jgi:hypothetical protein
MPQHCRQADVVAVSRAHEAKASRAASNRAAPIPWCARSQACPSAATAGLPPGAAGAARRPAPCRWCGLRSPSQPVCLCSFAPLLLVPPALATCRAPASIVPAPPRILCDQPTALAPSSPRAVAACCPACPRQTLPGRAAPPPSSSCPVCVHGRGATGHPWPCHRRCGCVRHPVASVHRLHCRRPPTKPNRCRPACPRRVLCSASMNREGKGVRNLNRNFYRVLNANRATQVNSAA